MKAFQIYSDSSCDLPDSLIKKYDIRLIPFYVSFDHDTYFKENIEISNGAFYEKLTTGNTDSTTSMPSVQDYMNEFKEALRNGLDIICLCLSHKLSGSYQSAMNAKLILEEQYPGALIQVINSIQATAGQGVLLLQIAYMKEVGMPLEDIVERIEYIKNTARIMFSVDSLDYLQKGRRIGKAAALKGSILDLKPLILLKDAELLPYTNIRGRKKSLETVFDMVCEYFDETGESPADYDFGIANATTMEDAKYLQNQVEEYIGRKISYPVFQIGVTIGTYTGPGAIGICFVKKYNCI